MENSDRELIRKVLQSNNELARLYHEHCQLEDLLTRFEHMVFMTPSEEMEVKALKRKKLSGVDRMMAIVSEHRTEM